MQLRLCIAALGASVSQSRRVVHNDNQELRQQSPCTDTYDLGCTVIDKEHGIERTEEMEQFNVSGYCPDGYIAGWDGLYLELEACKEACAENSGCEAISFCAPGTEKCGWQGSCTRFAKSCNEENLITDTENAPDHVTFSKPSFEIVTYEEPYEVREKTKESYENMKTYIQETLPAGGKVAVISMLGSFAPLTKAHLNAFIVSREELLQRGFDAAVGIMSFNPEGHVRGKLNSKGQPNVPFNKRHQLASCAFKDAKADWMFTEFQETLNFNALRKEKELKLKNYSFQLFVTNGADDVYAGRKYDQCGKTFPDGRKFIMVGRPGDTDKVKEQLERVGITGEDTECLWVDNYNSFSSSMLRKAAMGGMQDKVRVIADKCVAAFMNGPYMQQLEKKEEKEEKEEE